MDYRHYLGFSVQRKRHPFTAKGKPKTSHSLKYDNNSVEG